MVGSERERKRGGERVRERVLATQSAEKLWKDI